jgi:DNA recombination protein RmuC
MSYESIAVVALVVVVVLLLFLVGLSIGLYRKIKLVKSQPQETQTLDSIKASILELKQTLHQVDKDQAYTKGQLSEKLSELVISHKAIYDQTQELKLTLQGSTKSQGLWGEIVLEKVLELSGLKRDRDFTTQASLTLENGSKVRPDVIVALPQKRFVIIDAKVSLQAFSNYSQSINQGTPNEQLLKEHIHHMRTHISQLGKKRYQEIHGASSLEVVLMFVPMESALSEVLNGDHGFLAFALDHKVLPVTPTTLLLSLQLIHNLWNQQEQDNQAKEIMKKSREILQKTDELWGQVQLLLQRIEAAGAQGAKVEKLFTSPRNGILPLVSGLTEHEDPENQVK